MKNFFVIKSKRSNWTNKPAREALGISSRSQAIVKHNGRQLQVELRRAPKRVLRVLSATYAATGLFGLALEPFQMRELGVKPGDKLDVVNPFATNTASSAKPKTETAQTEKKLTLSDRVAALKVGDELTASENAVKSGIYSIAKSLGIKVSKVNATTIKRVS